MISETFPDRSRRRNPLLLPVRLLLYWIIKVLVLLFLGIRFLLRPWFVRYGLLILAVGGGIAWRTVGPTYLPWSTASAPQEMVSTAVTSELPQPAAPERYFKAQSIYDANGMWDTMNDQLKRRMAAANNAPEQLQKALDNAKQQQRRYGSVTYVGGLALNNGQSSYFYVLTVDGPNGSSQLPYTFIVDGEGKISNIQWSMER